MAVTAIKNTIIPMNDLRQDAAYAEYMARLGWVVEHDIDNDVFVYVRRLPLLPVSVMKIQRPKRLSLAWIDEVAKKHRSIIRYVEPVDRKQAGQLKQAGYRLHRSPFLPTKTLVLDLRLSEKRLLAGMKSKTRYNITLTQKKGVRVTVVTGKELLKNEPTLIKLNLLLAQNSRRVRVFGMPEAWLRTQLEVFGERCLVVFVQLRDEVASATSPGFNPLAVAVFLTSKDTVFYGPNGSTKQGRKLMAPTLCVWEGMRAAKKRGLKRFDFDGIYDSRFPRKRWKGFSRFKRGFGGQALEFPGLWKRWL